MGDTLFTVLTAALICTILVWVLRQMMLTPVRCGRNTSQTLLLRINGSEPKLEENLCALIWLSDNGIIRYKLVIHGCDLDEETRFVAKCYANEYKGILFFEDGEIGQWIRNLNCWNYPEQ